MEWNWLSGLIYGLLGGLFEFLPVSPQVHQAVLMTITGLPSPGYGLPLGVHLGALAAVTLSYYTTIGKLNRERRLASQPRRNRKRQPDITSLMQLRLLRLAAVPLVLSGLVSPWLGSCFPQLWLMVIMTVLSGIVVLLPQHMPWANKDARTLSPLDAVLMGLSGIAGMLPGFSRVGLVTAAASVRGADREFGLEFTYLLMIPVLTALSVGDLGMILFGGAPDGGISFLTGVLACIAAFGAALAGIRLMRFLAVKAGFESFAYHSWGIALLTLIFYLIG